jgi:hypothetical protein
MLKQTVEQGNRWRDFEKVLFTIVTFRSYPHPAMKGLYKVFNQSGDSAVLCDHDLFRQKEIRPIFLKLTGKIMPIMSESDYLEFVQKMLDHMEVFEPVIE